MIRLARLAAIPTLGKILIGGVGVAALAVAGWVYALNAQVDDLQNKLDKASRQVGRAELVIEGLQRDNSHLRETLEIQNIAIRDLAHQRTDAERRAQAQAELIAALKTPPAGDTAEDMQRWWDENVARR